MIRKSQFFNLILVLLMASACRQHAGNGIVITGTAPGRQGTVIKIYQVLPESAALADSVQIKDDGTFSAFIRATGAGIYSLTFSAGEPVILVTAPGEKIQLVRDATSGKWAVTGSAKSAYYADYKAFTSQTLAKIDSLGKEFLRSKADAQFPVIKKKLDNDYSLMLEKQRRAGRDFIQKHPGSLASLLVINQRIGPTTLFAPTSDAALFLLLDSTLTALYPANELVTDFHEKTTALWSNAVNGNKIPSVLTPGNSAPAISLPAQNGKPLALASCKGKLTVLYFWASWNSDCRRTNQALAPLYAEFRDKAFEIYAVSLDTEPDTWQQAIHLDKAYWKNVIDTGGLNSEIARTYGVTRLPQLFVIDKHGKIIAAGIATTDLKTLITNNL